MQNDLPEFLTIICPTCNARVSAPLQQAGEQIKCPDCFLMLKIPDIDSISAEQVKLQTKSTIQKEQESVGAYAIIDDSIVDDSIIDTDDTPQESSVSNKEADDFRTVCPHCAAPIDSELLDSASNETTTHLTCSQCFEIFDTPAKPQPSSQSPPETRTKRNSNQRRKRSRSSSKKSGNSTEESNEAQWKSPFDAMAEIRQVVPPPIPRWTFFSGVFNFPWRKDTVARWGYFTFGLMLLEPLFFVVWWLISEYYIIAIPFFALPIIWIGILTTSYGVACWSVILEETAAGNDEIHGWLAPVWGDWLMRFLAIGYTTVLSSFIPAGIAALFRSLTGSSFSNTIFVVLLFLVWPIFILSSLDSNSLFVPLTRRVVRSVVRFWRYWLLYYLLTVSLFCGLFLCGLLLLFTPKFYPILLLPAPFISTIVFIQARWLGRLAWKVIVVPAMEETTEEDEENGDKKNSDTKSEEPESHSTL